MERKRLEPIEEEPETTQLERLEALLQEIGEDARRKSGTYMKETVVPEGGE
jgi:hypothetical protein